MSVLSIFYLQRIQFKLNYICLFFLFSSLLIGKNYKTVAVVVAFILCWAPFHAQRLVAFYDNDQPVLYAIITYTSGILYYLSTCINPLLYNLMSNKFREAFKVCINVFYVMPSFFSLIFFIILFILM